MSLEVSSQIIFFSMRTCTIGSQSAPNKMAAANFLSAHFLNNKSSIRPFFTGGGGKWDKTLRRETEHCFLRTHLGYGFFFSHRNSSSTREGTQSREKETEPGD